MEMKGTKKRGSPSNYRKLLCAEIGCDGIRLQNEMQDSDNWRKLVQKITK